MNELELKYGCNPNQKPSRIYMKDGSTKARSLIRINNSHLLSTDSAHRLL